MRQPLIYMVVKMPRLECCKENIRLGRIHQSHDLEERKEVAGAHGFVLLGQAPKTNSTRARYCRTPLVGLASLSPTRSSATRMRAGHPLPDSRPVDRSRKTRDTHGQKRSSMEGRLEESLFQQPHIRKIPSCSVGDTSSSTSK